MLFPVLAGITAFAGSFSILPFLITFTRNQRIVDAPDKRRIHTKLTPTLGGAAIFLGFTLGCIIWTNASQWMTTLSLLCLLIIPFGVGILDDVIHLRPVAKLISQVFTASIIFFLLNIRLTSTYGLFGDIALNPVTSYLVTLATVIIITNSLNLIDGIDGLAGVLSLISILVFGAWFFFTESYQFSMVCFALGGGILAFLFQNWEPSKIFMGDTGSLVIGTVLSIVTIQFINENYELAAQNKFRFSSSIGSAIAIIIIPLTDTARIVIIRLSKNLSPFKADKRHIHHALVRISLSHRQVVYILALVHVLFISLAVLFIDSGEYFVLPGIIALATALCLVLDRIVMNIHSRVDTKIKSHSVGTYED